MPNLGDYMEPVPFNWAAAESLVDMLRATSDVLYRQLPDREQVSHRARVTWEGPYSQWFDGETHICLGDGERFVTTLRMAANQLEELAQQARMEQLRRDAVRDGLARWEMASAQYAAAGQPPPPMEWYVPQNPPIQPPLIPPVDCPPTPRVTAASAGGGTGQSSADPDALNRWVAESQGLDKLLSQQRNSLEEAHNAFRASSAWGNFDASPLIESLRTYLVYNGDDAKSTWDISEAFRHADSGDADAAIMVALTKAGSGPAGGAGTGPSGFGRKPDYMGNPGYRLGRPVDASRLHPNYPRSTWDDDLRELEAVKARHPELRDIPTEEMAAVKSFTRDGFFRKWNRGLYRGDKELMDDFDEHSRAATSALNRLPVYEGSVVRRVALDTPEEMAEFFRQHQVGEIVEWRGFASASISNPWQAMSGQALVHISGIKTGRDVSLIAKYSFEGEVIFPPGARVRVLRVETDRRGVTHIYAEEV